jgi:16S rRNA (guanine(966)-N(2))-methyltransferase RsmD
MRERVFAVLGDRIQDARFLDLFAGTASVGLEALSRGARSAVFVEHHRAAARLASENCTALGLDESRARVLVRPVLSALRDLARRGEVFDLVWADPPFDRWKEGLEALTTTFGCDLLAPGAIACLECPAETDLSAAPPVGLRIKRDLTGGASRVVIIERSGRPLPSTRL